MSLDTNNHGNIAITSFNCHNVKTSADEIRDFCCTCSILFLQETWLADFKLFSLSTIHPDLYDIGKSSIDTLSGLKLGCPHGGMCILWKKELGNICNIIDIDDSRIMGIELWRGNIKIIILNVYLPCKFTYYLMK